MVRSTASPFEKVRSTRAHERIVEQLQRLILSGKLPPGSRLPSERSLMAEFEVSRPTVREALRVAESMGLISIRHGDPGGPKVLGTPSLGIARVLDGLVEAGCASAPELIEMRIILDSSSAALASLQPKERLSKASELLGKMRDAADPDAFAQLDAGFHEAIAVASGNRLFHVVFQALDQPIRTLIKGRLASSAGPSREHTLQQHAAILDAIRGGQPQQAASAARSHLRQFYFPGLSAQERSHMRCFMRALDQAD